MRFRRSGLIVPALAAMLMASISSAAIANRSLRIGSTSNNYTARLSIPAEGGETIECNITMGLRFASSVKKEPEARMGTVTESRFAGCRGGVRIPGVLPGPPEPEIVYKFFQGTLPSVTGLLFTIERYELLVDTFFEGGCLYSVTIEILQPVEGAPRLLSAVGALQEDLAGGFFPCSLSRNIEALALRLAVAMNLTLV